MSESALVVTSIASPNAALGALSKIASLKRSRFYVLGDGKSPAQFELEGCEFYSLDVQRKMEFQLAGLCPEGSYTRKNLGYLQAMRDGATRIHETDDDNFPCDEFGTQNAEVVDVDVCRQRGWINAWNYFLPASDKEVIWPRGFPLEFVRDGNLNRSLLRRESVRAPIQQGLANENPDVDAIYRLLHPLPRTFLPNKMLALGEGAWCPFNSQNTTWFQAAFPLMYLPAHCSFRMTDIWRSFVAQRVAWANGWCVLHHSPTVWQDRNAHDLMKDFEQEVSGYVNNRAFCECLDALPVREGVEHIPDNMVTCYQALIGRGWIGAGELGLLTAWLEDVKDCSKP